MPIRWNTAKVSSAADMMEEFLTKAVAPLESAREVAKKALKIPNIPQYIEQDFRRAVGEVDSALGGGYFNMKGWFKNTVERIRADISSEALKADQADEKHGATQAML